MRRHITETGTDCGGSPCAHLYEIDPQTAAVEEIGYTGEVQLAEIAFADGSFFGTGFRSGCCSALFTIDETTAQVDFIPDTGTVGFGDNPFDSGSDLQRGGFAVHPVTGDFWGWGIENQLSDAPTVYRIDPVKGAADRIMRLGLGGTETDHGFDAMQIRRHVKTASRSEWTYVELTSRPRRLNAALVRSQAPRASSRLVDGPVAQPGTRALSRSTKAISHAFRSPPA